MASTILIFILLGLAALAGLAGVIALIIGIMRKKRGLWITGLVILLLSLCCCVLVTVAGALAYTMPVQTSDFFESDQNEPEIWAVTEVPFDAEQDEPGEEVTEEPAPDEADDPDDSFAPDGYSSETELGDGPWWLLLDVDNRLWAVNTTTGEQTLVYPEPVHYMSPLTDWIAPQGGHVAFVTGEDPDAFDWILHVAALTPDGITVTDVTPLIEPSADIDPNGELGEPHLEALRAITDTFSVAWSPDGTKLAYPAVSANTVADLFVYDVEQGTAFKLTDNDFHTVAPSWSLDNDTIIFTTVESFGTGAGWSIDGLWTVTMSEKTPEMLITLDGTGENRIAWLSDSEVVTSNWNAICGDGALSVTNIVSGGSQVIWPDCYSSNVVVNPDDGVALFNVSPDLADWNETDSTTGLAFADLNSGGITWVDVPAGGYWLAYHPSGRHFTAVSDEYMLIIDNTGSVVSEMPCNEDYCNISPAPGGPSWAMNGAEGLSAGFFGSEGELVVEDYIMAYTWLPVSETLLYMTPFAVYTHDLLTGATEELTLTGDIYEVYDEAWVQP